MTIKTRDFVPGTMLHLDDGRTMLIIAVRPPKNGVIRYDFLQTSNKRSVLCISWNYASWTTDANIVILP